MSNIKTDKFIHHEALHTTNLIVEMIDDHLINHHYYHNGTNPKFNARVDKAIKQLAKAYQECGNDNI